MRAENLSSESLQIFTLKSLIMKSKLLDGAPPGLPGPLHQQRSDGKWREGPGRVLPCFRPGMSSKLPEL